MLECKQSKCSIVINKSRWIRKVMKWYSGYSILRSRLEWLKLVHLNILDCKQRCTGSDKYVTVMLQVWHVTVTPLNLRKCEKEVTGTPLSRKNVTSHWQWASDKIVTFMSQVWKWHAVINWQECDILAAETN